MEKLNFAFIGTPDISRDTLDILFSCGHIPSLIITSPDRKSGRGLELKETPVSAWAKDHNIKYLKPEKLDASFMGEFEKYNIDLSIVVAYGKILPEKLINLPKLGTINIHYSLLPKYRGASPLESALLNGDTVTGVSIQQMAFKLDSGPILAEIEVPIDINETKKDLKIKLIKLGGNLLCEIIPNIINKNIIPKIQEGSKATYCSKIKKEDGEVDLTADPLINYNKYRAFYEWPGVYFYKIKNDKKIRVKIKEASYENNLFVIKRVTPEGKKEISYEDFLKQN